MIQRGLLYLGLPRLLCDRIVGTDPFVEMGRQDVDDYFGPRCSELWTLGLIAA